MQVGFVRHARFASTATFRRTFHSTTIRHSPTHTTIFRHHHHRSALAASTSLYSGSGHRRAAPAAVYISVTVSATSLSHRRYRFRYRGRCLPPGRFHTCRSAGRAPLRAHNITLTPIRPLHNIIHSGPTGYRPFQPSMLALLLSSRPGYYLGRVAGRAGPRRSGAHGALRARAHSPPYFELFAAIAPASCFAAAHAAAAALPAAPPPRCHLPFVYSPPPPPFAARRHAARRCRLPPGLPRMLAAFAFAIQACRLGSGPVLPP